MMESWITPELAQRFAGSLLHFIWQGALIAMFAAVVLRLLADRSAESRYTVSLAALLLMLASPVVTFVYYTETGRATLVLLRTINNRLTASTPSVTQAATTTAWTQWIVLLWFIGVLICSIRLMAGWRISRSLAKVGTSVVPSEIQQSFNEIVGRLALTKPVRLLASLRIDTPVAVGWLRPVVLLPLAALTGLDEEQLRAVFAHELAHIRRHDFLVNMIQRGVESILFYHPAVWWLSSRIRSEREHCCDDLAVRICGDRSVYAQALMELERVRTVEPELAVSAAGSRLTQRIHRILGFRSVENDWQSAIAALLFVVVWVMLGVLQSEGTLNARPVVPPPVSAPVVVKTAERVPKLEGAISAIAAIVTAEAVQIEPQKSAVAAEVPGGTQAQTGVVTGILRTSTGLPLGGVRIAVTPVDQSIAFGALERQGLTGLTDSAGQYRLERISPGRYHILIGMNGPRFYYPGVAELGRATAILVATGATTEVPDTVVPGGAVTGQLVDMATGRGLRVENLVLCCDYFRGIGYSRDRYSSAVQPRFGAPFNATISADGSFVFPFVPSGNYFLSAGDSQYISVSWAIAVGPGGASGLRLDVPEGEAVQGTVLDQTGKPVSAEVKLRPEPADSVFNTVGPPTATGGSFFFFNDPAKTEFGSSTYGLFIPKVDPSLEGVQDRLVDTARARILSTSAGPDGRFEFAQVFPGTYVLEVKSGGVTLPGREIQVGAAGLKDVSFQVQALKVTGRVISPSGGPLPKLNYIRLTRSGTDMEILYSFPDTEGHFSLVLLPGVYRVFTERLGPAVQSVSEGSRDIMNTEFRLESGDNAQIVITLEP